MFLKCVCGGGGQPWLPLSLPRLARARLLLSFPITLCFCSKYQISYFLRIRTVDMSSFQKRKRALVALPFPRSCPESTSLLGGLCCRWAAGPVDETKCGRPGCSLQRRQSNSSQPRFLIQEWLSLLSSPGSWNKAGPLIETITVSFVRNRGIKIQACEKQERASEGTLLSP